MSTEMHRTSEQEARAFETRKYLHNKFDLARTQAGFVGSLRDSTSVILAYSMHTADRERTVPIPVVLQQFLAGYFPGKDIRLFELEVRRNTGNHAWIDDVLIKVEPAQPQKPLDNWKKGTVFLPEQEIIRLDKIRLGVMDSTTLVTVHDATVGEWYAADEGNITGHGQDRQLLEEHELAVVRAIADMLPNPHKSTNRLSAHLRFKTAEDRVDTWPVRSVKANF